MTEITISIKEKTMDELKRLQDSYNAKSSNKLLEPSIYALVNTPSFLVTMKNQAINYWSFSCNEIENSANLTNNSRVE